MTRGAPKESCSAFAAECVPFTQRPDGWNRPEFQALADAIQRCHNERHRAYRLYGARGIAVCDEWRGRGGFARFLAHIGPRPDGCSLDRINNSRGYEPGNVRWATPLEQAQNTRVFRGVRLAQRERAAQRPSRAVTKPVACACGKAAKRWRGDRPLCGRCWLASTRPSP